MNVTSTDVAVVGAGPIGIELAVALRRAGIDYLQFDARQIGYTVSWFAPQTRFFSSNERIAVAGVPLETADQSKASREQYLAYLRSVVRQFGLAIRTYEPVVGIDRTDGGFRLTTHSRIGRQMYHARRLVLATGGTDRPRRLNVEGEDLPHVSHYFQDPHTYFGRRLLIVGGKNSAVEAALRCHHAGAKVAISYRRRELDGRSIKYWLTPEINSLISAGRIEAHFQTTVERITETEVVLEGEGIRHEGTKARRHEGEEGTPVAVSADFVLLLTGYEADVTLLKLAGVTLQGACQSPRFDERTMETDVPGLYVAGTATGGTQDKYTLFIENCHVHVERIMAALTGASPPVSPAPLDRPES